MSIEKKIEALTAAIVALTEKLDSQALPAEAPAKVEAATKAETPKQETAKPTLTHDDVQQLCLAIVRKDRSKKPALKKVLENYGAVLVADVPAEKLADLKADLEKA